jgi:hypothetical protein
MRKLVAKAICAALAPVLISCGDNDLRLTAGLPDVELFQGDRDFRVYRVEGSVRAGDPFSAPVMPADLDDPSKFTFSLSSPETGMQFLAGDASILWQSDLQDIGKARQGTYSVSYARRTLSETYRIDVLPPEVPKAPCSYEADPVIGNVLPEKKWHFNGWAQGNSAGALRYYLTYSAPAVGDLDGDGKAEVVTLLSQKNYRDTNGPVVVLNGKTGAPLWNTLEAGVAGLDASTTPSLQDLDGDGYSEIIAASVTGPNPSKSGSYSRELVVLDYRNRSVKARYSEGFVCEKYCQTAVGDIDADGAAEIVSGNVILNHQAGRKAFLSPAPVSPDISVDMTSTTTLADLVPTSPGLEIIANGSQVYSASGARLWAGSCLGYSAVADLEADGSPELICVGTPEGSPRVGGLVLGSVYVYESDGALRWSVAVPNDPAITANNHGGPPNIGNFTGDSDFEIGLAGGEYYFVLDKDGSLVWFRPTKDHSSNKTGSTIFDFNGDGLVEVIYNDEDKLRIYDGRDGAILWETANPSGTLFEYPVVANIDEDPSVEIVVSAPGSSGTSADLTIGGVKAFDDPTNLWVGSRKLWNQYSYYPELVTDSLRPPAAGAALPFPRSGFRMNTQGALRSGDRILLPDVSLIWPQFLDDSADSITLFVRNSGEAPIPDGVPVRIFGQDGPLLGEASTKSAIAAGSGEAVKIPIPSDFPAGGLITVHTNLKSDGSPFSRECVDVNNRLTIALPGRR